MSEPRRFAFTSRGDAIAGWLWREAAPGPVPLVLVTPALGASARAPEVEALCRALGAAGLAAAALDLPLQGERRSAKLSARLLAAAARTPRRGADERLWAEFLRQAALDLAAALDALAREPGVAAARVACVAFEPGAEAAAGFAALDARVRGVHAVAAGAPPGPLAARLAASLRGST